MINKYKDFKPERTTARETLPAGGYVGKILDANVLNYDWGEVLKIDFDIAEGDYKGFFAADYRANTSDNKKWRGSFRLNVPNERNQWYENQCKSFNNFVACVEESNNGFHWAWEEKALKGKFLGFLFRNKEYAIDGDNGHFEGWTTECCAVTTVDDIREGNFKMPKDKPLDKSKSKGKSAQASSAFTELEGDDGDLPF